MVILIQSYQFRRASAGQARQQVAGSLVFDLPFIALGARGATLARSGVTRGAQAIKKARFEADVKRTTESVFDPTQVFSERFIPCFLNLWWLTFCFSN